MDNKPKLKLVGEDGNAFAILGRMQAAAREAKWPAAKVTEVMVEARSGDFDLVLQTAMKYFDVY